MTQGFFKYLKGRWLIILSCNYIIWIKKYLNYISKIQLFHFYHLDYTIGTGITPVHVIFILFKIKTTRGLYHRSGISPCPEVLNLFLN